MSEVQMIAPKNCDEVTIAGGHRIVIENGRVAVKPEHVQQLRQLGFRAVDEKVTEIPHPGMARNLKPPMEQICEALGLQWGAPFNAIMEKIAEGRAAIEQLAKIRAAQARGSGPAPITAAAKK